MSAGYFLDRAAPDLHKRLMGLLNMRMVFLAGLPGTGKSLLVHQLAHLAVGRREIHILQWDVARLPFEASEAGQPYPILEGVTHPLIRRAVGLWARQAIGAWLARHDEHHLLIGEVPIAGNRLIELTQVLPDSAEPDLTSPGCRFVLLVPSAQVRRHIEAERRRRASTPRNYREGEDAPPQVLQDSWLAIAQAGRKLGLVETSPADYDGGVYEAVYRYVLRARHVDVQSIETLLPTEAMSVYDFDVPCHYLSPSPDEAAHFIHAAELMGRTEDDRLLN